MSNVKPLNESDAKIFMRKH